MTTPFTLKQVDTTFESFFNKIKNGFCDPSTSAAAAVDDDDDDDIVGTHREITILHQVAEPPVGDLLTVLATDTTEEDEPFMMAEEQTAFLDAYESEPVTRQQRVNRMMETKIYTIVLVFLTWLALYQLGYRLEFSINQSGSSAFPIQLNKRKSSTAIKVPVVEQVMEQVMEEEEEEKRHALTKNQQEEMNGMVTMEAPEHLTSLNTEIAAEIPVDSSFDESINEEL